VGAPGFVVIRQRTNTGVSPLRHCVPPVEMTDVGGYRDVDGYLVVGLVVAGLGVSAGVAGGVGAT
jgi:hypothetical protein